MHQDFLKSYLIKLFSLLSFIIHAFCCRRSSNFSTVIVLEVVIIYSSDSHISNSNISCMNNNSISNNKNSISHCTSIRYSSSSSRCSNDNSISISTGREVAAVNA